MHKKPTDVNEGKFSRNGIGAGPLLLSDTQSIDFDLDTINDEARDRFTMKRLVVHRHQNGSLSRASFRQSFKSSKSKLDEFFRSPLEFGKRKRPVAVVRDARNDEEDDERDNVSLAPSDDFSIDEPKTKRRSSLAKVTSLAALLSPVVPAKRVGHALQKSLSSWTLKSLSGAVNKPSGVLGSGAASGRPGGGGAAVYKDPATYFTPPRRRLSTYWHETVDSTQLETFDKKDIDRQEAIFEVFKSEQDLVDDLKMIKTTYVNSMRKLGLMSDEELEKIFGHIDTLIPIHQELVDEMKEIREQSETGSITNIGPTLLDWVPRLGCYVSYCANQVYTRALLDDKKEDAHIKDFLDRCQESSFSRHLDLWSFLDVPRSRLVKYPLLLKTIKKHTDADHTDQALIDKALVVLDRIINDVDTHTGFTKCTFIKSRLQYFKQPSYCINESTMVICDGVLRNARGTKLYVCLFDRGLVLTRSASSTGATATGGSCTGGVQYQIYRDPIPIDLLAVEDMKEGGGGGGSFKNVFAPSQPVRNAFRVSLRCCTVADDSVSLNGDLQEDRGTGTVPDRGTGSAPSRSTSHVLYANDELDKQHWLRCIRTQLEKNVVYPGGTTVPCQGSFDNRTRSGTDTGGDAAGGLREATLYKGSLSQSPEHLPVAKQEELHLRDSPSQNTVPLPRVKEEEREEEAKTFKTKYRRIIDSDILMYSMKSSEERKATSLTAVVPAHHTSVQSAVQYPQSVTVHSYTAPDYCSGPTLSSVNSNTTVQVPTTAAVRSFITQISSTSAPRSTATQKSVTAALGNTATQVATNAALRNTTAPMPGTNALRSVENLSCMSSEEIWKNIDDSDDDNDDEYEL